MRAFDWLKVEPEGLYCVPGEFYIDPISPVRLAVITHGHADHAKAGHQGVIATKKTLAIMKLRYGNDYTHKSQSLAYGEKIKIKDVYITLLPAGHIFGSAQIVIEYKNNRIIVSGDYKRALDPTCEPFEVSFCDLFITESTFALPIFTHPPIDQEIQKLLQSINTFPERCHLMGAYGLGKCQRLMIALRLNGYHETIYLHGAMKKICDLYASFGIPLENYEVVNEQNASSLAGKIVICPPGALHDRWTRRLPNVLPGFASGWMKIRSRAKQLKVELPLVISDHADWNELLTTIQEVNAPEIWITHGMDEALSYAAQSRHYKTRSLKLLGYEDEGEEKI